VYQTNCAQANAVSGATGALDQDDLDDLVIGSTEYCDQSPRGAALLFRGTGHGFATEPTVFKTDEVEFDARVGDGVAIGDLNNDGVNDLAVGAPGYGANNEGAVLVWYSKLCN
jgi:hypothetical protein